MIKVKVFAVNPFREAMYIVSDDTLECVIIDCGMETPSEKKRVDGYILSKGLKPVMAINTHCHIDHILGIAALKNTYDIPFAASFADT
ncbi:MAG: MBL fold metallo-hydrolase, partial [Rikenellaceae bacterium]